MLLPAYFESAIDFAAAYCNANIVFVSHYIDDHVQGMLGVLAAFTSTFFHTRSIAKMDNPVKFRAFVAQKPQFIEGFSAEICGFHATNLLKF
jgi:metal-dependent hydrolase (beta-lactamase superfamily II)